ncbi:hypothetical protein ACLOAV_010823 [Pseudogymnoascus australis]
MDETSRADLLERFRKRIVALNAHIEKLERLRTPPTGLLRLPFEIRLQIYGYCIPQKRVIEVIQPYFDTSFEDCTLEVEDNVHIVANPNMEFDPDSEYGASLQDRISWITSTGPASDADNIADEAYESRKDSVL